MNIAARKKLLVEEKRVMRLGDELAAARRKLPAVEIDRNYIFTSEAGEVSLKGLFGSSRQLIIYHFMYGPDWEEGCLSCSFWADNFNGAHEHLTARDTAFACVSNASIDQITAYKKRLGWWFPWVSAKGSSFSGDFGVTFTGPPENYLENYPKGYNYTGKIFAEELPGISTFLLDDTDEILHTYSSYGRGVEAINGAYHLLDLTAKGRHESELSGTMSWVKRRDSY